MFMLFVVHLKNDMTAMTLADRYGHMDVVMELLQAEAADDVKTKVSFFYLTLFSFDNRL